MKGKSLDGGLRYWMRVLRPLLWWVLFVLALYSIRTHERWMEKTRLYFTLTLQGQPLMGAATTVDGKPFATGEKIPLGSHLFEVTFPKGKTYATNLSVHYGGVNLGNIDLKRTKGTLALAVDPPADTLVINGPEWSAVMTNSSGLTNLMPADGYEIEAMYPHWRKIYNVSVFDDTTTPFSVAPNFGAIRLNCNQVDVSFRLQTTDGQSVSEGTLPAWVPGLPAGNYALVIYHHGNQRTERITVAFNATNDARCDFHYGAAVIETSPAGAMVLGDGGRNLGETPLSLSEMVPGAWIYTLQRAGYQSVQLSLHVFADQTNYVMTNLVSESYLHAVTQARQYMADADYDRALLSANDALAARLDDPDAKKIKQEAIGLGHLRKAQALGQTNDYVSGGRELALAIQALPDNGEIKDLIAAYKEKEPAQIERERVERLSRPKKMFDELGSAVKDIDLFDSHELTTSKPAKDVTAAIVTALEQEQPAYKVSGDTSPHSDIYTITANQTDANLITTTGWRQCLILCGQSRDDETQIYFKVMEYTTKHKVTMPGLLAFKDDVEMVPINSSKIPDMTEKLNAQVDAGVSNLTMRIQRAITEAAPIH